MAHHSQQIVNSGAENQKVHDHESGERGPDRRRVNWRDPVRSAQKSVDDIGLAAHFGGHPTRQNRQELIELEVLNALDRLEANWQRILANRQNAILTGRLFEAEKRQFEIGLGTSTDVLDAQTAFANAQSSEISALTEYQIALVDIAYATGTLLGSAKIQWEPIREQ